MSRLPDAFGRPAHGTKFNSAELFISNPAAAEDIGIGIWKKAFFRFPVVFGKSD